MRHVKHAAEFVFQTVAGKVAAVISAARQTVVGETAGPHDLSPGVIILRFLHQDLRVPDHRPHQPFRDFIRQLHVGDLCKIPLLRVHKDVRAAAGRLVCRERHREFRVADREFRPGQIAVVGALAPGLLVGDNAGVAHLAAGCRDGQDHAHRHAGIRSLRVLVELPDIAVQQHPVADSLAGVRDAAAAHCQKEVDALLFAKFDSFTDLGKMGIRDHAAQLAVSYAALFQRLFHAAYQPGPHRASAAVMDQDLRPAVLLHQLPGLIFRAASKVHLCRRVVYEIVHTALLF